MIRKDFSHNPSTLGFSIAISPSLFASMLVFSADALLSPLRTKRFVEDFSKDIEEFSDKLSPLALNRKLSGKHLLGVKLTIYYED